ncbi:integrase-like protein [Streptomyces sp. 846.5]|nr:N-terminal phage integrase SAM-like domain-containing protein [Streptomyces sp. 846.5]TDU03449.1 integrase-like protein [Streptomyces sp. 846.5]
MADRAGPDRVSNEVNSRGERKRTTRRRSGFSSRAKAAQALRLFLLGEATGVYADPDESVSQYLEHWLATKQERLKAATFVQYRDYIAKDLAPAFGALRLDDLRTRHIEHGQLAQLRAGRGRTLFDMEWLLGFEFLRCGFPLRFHPANQPPGQRCPIGPSGG